MAYYVCDVERVSTDAARQAEAPKVPFGLELVSSPSLVPGGHSKHFVYLEMAAREASMSSFLL
eukprot:1157264-Pelagomonas_calceolata.AAC.2